MAALEDQLLALCGAGGGAAAAPDLLAADAPEQLAAPPEAALRAVYASHALARCAPTHAPAHGARPASAVCWARPRLLDCTPM